MTRDTPSPEGILALLPAHQGHFRFESGHHGTRWLDVERLYLHPPRVQRLAVLIAGRIAKYDVQVVCKPLVDGVFASSTVSRSRHSPRCRTTCGHPTSVRSVWQHSGRGSARTVD